MKKLLFLSLFLVSIGLNVFSQSLITVDYTAINPSAPGNCDGSFVINSIPNGTPPYAYNWYNMNGSLAYSSSTGSFYNLCEDVYYVQIFDAACNVVYVSVTMETYTGNINALVLENISVIDETSPGACDGSIVFGVNNYSPNLVVETMDFFTLLYTYTGNMTSNPMTIPSICLSDSNGVYFSVYDSLGIGAEFLSFNQNINNILFYPSGNCGSLNVWTETTLTSDTNTCDASASTLVWGGLPPYTFDYSFGGTNSVENNLCTGYYSVMVTDSNGDTASTNFVIVDSTQYYQMYFWGSPYDTLYTNALANCDLDYSQPIDSMYLDTMYYVSAYDITVSYVIIQDTAEFLWTETYHVDTTANYILSVSMYCDNRSMEDVYTLMAWLPMADMATLGIPSTIIQSIDIHAKIYPNPVEDILTTSFKLERQDNVEISITDITGKLVSTKSIKAIAGNNSVQMNVNGLSNGIYLVNYLVNGQKIQSLKMIKE